VKAEEKNVVCYNLFEAFMNLSLPRKKLDSFCQRWKVRELALFGSALRSDFRPDSDIDVLISFDPAARWSAFDLLTMQEELKSLLGRKVDLVEREALRNPFRRQSILKNREIIYAVSGS
jgi:predicted nucleotidyltransferase